MADISCSQVLAEYYAIKKQVLDLLEIPFALIAAAENLLDQAVGAAEDLLGSAIGLLDGLVPDLSAGDLLNSLYRLLECSYIASSAIGGTIAGAIDALEEGLALPQDMVDLLQKQAMGYVGDAIDSVTATPYGKLAELDEMYRNLINNPAVNSAMSALRDIEQCLDSLCAGYEAGEFSYGNIATKLGTAADNTVTGVVGAVQTAPETVKASATTFSTNIKALKDTASTSTFGSTI